MSSNGTSLTARAIWTIVIGLVREVLASRLLSAVLARRSMTGTLPRTSPLMSLRDRLDMYCCWLPMRPRSLPSPTPWRVRRNCSAWSPSTVCVPAAMSRPVKRSLMGVARQTSTPPMEFVISITPPKVTDAANSMSWPVISVIVLATQLRPPSVYAPFSGCLLIADATLPSSRVHSGIGSIRSRGKLTAVMRRGSSETCTRMLTSLRLPAASSPVHLSPNSCA